MTDAANPWALALLKKLKGQRLTDRQCVAVIKLVADAHEDRDKPAYVPGKVLRTELIAYVRDLERALDRAKRYAMPADALSRATLKELQGLFTLFDPPKPIQIVAPVVAIDAALQTARKALEAVPERRPPPLGKSNVIRQLARALWRTSDQYAEGIADIDCDLTTEGKPNGVEYAFWVSSYPDSPFYMVAEAVFEHIGFEDSNGGPLSPKSAINSFRGTARKRAKLKSDARRYDEMIKGQSEKDQ